MSEILATSPRIGNEPATVEGRITNLMEATEVHVSGYLLSDSDRAKVVHALRALSLTAAPTADDAEQARELVRAGARCGALCTNTANCECAQQGAAAFASIRASQAAEVAALKGELLAVREALGAAVCCLAFFASAIKSGENWTETCEAEFERVRQLSRSSAAIRAANATGET